MSYANPATIQVSQLRRTTKRRSTELTINVIGHVDRRARGRVAVEMVQQQVGVLVDELFQRRQVRDGVGAGDGPAAERVRGGVAVWMCGRAEVSTVWRERVGRDRPEKWL